MAPTMVFQLVLSVAYKATGATIGKMHTHYMSPEWSHVCIDISLYELPYEIQ